MTQRPSTISRQKIGSGSFRGRTNGSLELGSQYNIIGSSIPLVYGQQRMNLQNVFSEPENFSEPKKRKLLYLVGLGELEAIPKDEVYLDGIKLQDLDPEVFETLLGTGGSQNIPGLANRTVNVNKLGDTLEVNDNDLTQRDKTGNPHPWTEFTTSTQVDSVDVIIEFTNGIYKINPILPQTAIVGKAWVEYQTKRVGTDSWSSTKRVEFNGKRENTRQTQPSVQSNTGFIVQVDTPRANTDRLKKAFSVPFDNQARYKIRVRRWYDPGLHTAGDRLIYQSQPSLPSNVFAINENVQEPLENDLAFVGVKISERKLQNDTPNASAFVKGRHTLTNQSWTTDEGYSRNPLWALWDALTLPEPAGPGIPEEKLLQWGAQNKSVADYCDQQIDDGDGGTETRHQLDFVLDEKKDVSDFVRHVESLYDMYHSEPQGGIRFGIKRDTSESDEVLVVGDGNIVSDEGKSSIKMETTRAQDISEKTRGRYKYEGHGFDRRVDTFSRTASSAPSEAEAVIDDHESGDTNDYNEGGINNDDNMEWKVVSEPVLEGQWALRAKTDTLTDDEQETLISTNLSDTPQRGDTITGYFKGDPDLDTIYVRPSVYFGVQSDDDRYRIYAQIETDPDSDSLEFGIEKIENGGVAKSQTSGDFLGGNLFKDLESYTAGDKWFKYVIDWGERVINAELQDNAGNTLASVSISDDAWDSGEWGYAFGADPNNAGGTIDDFENGDLSNYTEGPLGSEDKIDWSNQTNTAKEGNNALKANANWTSDSVFSRPHEMQQGTDLDLYPERGDVITGWVRTEITKEEDEHNMYVSFGIQDESGRPRYTVGINVNGNTELAVEKTKNDPNAPSVNGNSVSGDRQDTWLFLRIRWDVNGSGKIEAILEDGNENEIVSHSITDATHDSGDMGFEAEAKDSNDDDVDASYYWDDFSVSGGGKAHFDLAEYTRPIDGDKQISPIKDERDLTGLTRATEANRRLKEVTDRSQDEYLEITADAVLEPIRLTVGDSVWLAHPAVGDGWGESGMIVDSKSGSTTGWKLSSGSYTGNSADVSGQADSITDVRYRPDGTQMFVLSLSGIGDKVSWWDLSTNYDPSSKSNGQSESMTGQREGLDFSKSGERMWLTGEDKIEQFDLSTKYDPSTKTLSDSATPTEVDGTSIMGVFVGQSGSKLFLITNEVKIYEYNFDSANDITNLTFQNSQSLSEPGTEIAGLFFESNGDKFFTTDPDNDRVLEYTTGSSWSLSSAPSKNAELDVSGEDTSARGPAFGSNGKNMLIGGASNTDVYQYETQEATTTYAILDEEKSVDSSTSYELVYMDTNDDVQHEKVTFGSTKTTSVIPLPSSANKPKARTTYAWGEQSQNGNRVRLEKKREQADDVMRLTFRKELTTAKADAEGTSVNTDELERKLDKMDEANEPKELQATETSYIETASGSSAGNTGEDEPGRRVVPEITVHWDEPDDQPEIAGYNVYLNRVYDDDTSDSKYDKVAHEPEKTSINITDDLPVTARVGIKVTTVLTDGTETALSNAPEQTVWVSVKRDDNPPDPSNLTSTETEKGIKLEWDRPTDQLVKEFEIRLGRSWENARVLQDAWGETDYVYQEALTDAEYSFLVRTVSLQGTYSSNAVQVTHNVKNSGEENEIVSQDERTRSTAWPGTKTNCQKVTRNGDSVLVPDHIVSGSKVSDYTYQTNDISIKKDWEPTINCIWGVNIPTRNGATWNDLDESQDLTWQELAEKIGQPYTWQATDYHDGATVEYRTQTSSDGSYGSWQTFTGPVDGTEMNKIQFKINVDVRGGSDELRLRQFHVLLTAREKVLDKNTDSGLEDFTVNTSNTTLTYSNYTDQEGVSDEFYNTPVIIRAVNPSDTSGEVEVNNTSATSADFKEIGAGSSVDYDIEIRGY